MDEKNDYQQLNSIPVTSDKTGNVILRYAGVGHLYLSETDHRRAADICAAANGFLSVYGRAVTLFTKTNGRKIPIKGDNWQRYSTERKPAQDGYKSFMIDLSAEGEIPPFRFNLFTPYDLEAPDLAASFGRCAFHMPLTWLKSNSDAFVAHLKSWCSALKPEQGTFGIGLVCTAGMERKRTQDAWPLLARFSGLDHPTAMDWSAPKPHSGLRAVNWLTILDDTWVDRLGGMDAIAQNLHSQGIIHPYDGGLIVQACTHPQLGDINLTGVPKAYAAVDTLIAPHRYLDYPDKPMHLLKVPPPLDPHVTTVQWLRRFEPVEA